MIAQPHILMTNCRCVDVKGGADKPPCVLKISIPGMVSPGVERRTNACLTTSWWRHGPSALELGCPGFRYDVVVKDLGAPQAPKPRGVFSGLRLRPRGKMTRSLALAAAKAPCWWKDLAGASGARAALSWLESHLQDSGVKLGMSNLVETNTDEGNRGTLVVSQALFSSEEGSRWLWICPELLAALHTVRVFRPVSESLIASLRSRARHWAKERGLSVLDLTRVLAGTLVLAALPMPDEVVALGALRGSAAQWSSDVLGSLLAGKATPTNRGLGWADVFRQPLRNILGGGTKGSVLGGAGCTAIQMPK